MFTDMKEALEAEALELAPPGSGQSAAASLVAAHHAHDKDDLADLLSGLGLPCGEDDLVTLLRTTAADASGMTPGAWSGHQRPNPAPCPSPPCGIPPRS